MATQGEDRRAAPVPPDQGKDTVRCAGCALYGRADQPSTLSLTTTTPTRQGGLRIVRACRDCAVRTAPYAALVAALLHAAVPEVAPGQ